MPEQNGGLRIVPGDNGDIGRVLLSRFIRWLPALAATAFIGYTTQWFISWREQAATNRVIEATIKQMDQMQKDFRERIAWEDEAYIKRDEWLSMKATQDAALVEGLAGIERELGYIASGQRSNRDVLTRNTAILEKMPVPKEKK
jgi:hypothetical protein